MLASLIFLCVSPWDELPLSKSRGKKLRRGEGKRFTVETPARAGSKAARQFHKTMDGQ